MKTHRLGVILLVFCGFLIFENTRLMAQDFTDWSSWTSVVVNHKFNPSLRVMSKVQVRTRDDFGAFERFFVNAGLGYKVLPKWELKGVLPIIAGIVLPRENSMRTGIILGQKLPGRKVASEFDGEKDSSKLLL